MILLTDEGIRQELAKVPETNLYLPSAYEQTSIEWNEFVAKSQLKKVVEFIRQHQWQGHKGVVFDSPKGYLLSEDDVQALLEEVKE